MQNRKTKLLILKILLLLASSFIGLIAALTLAEILLHHYGFKEISFQNGHWEVTKKSAKEWHTTLDLSQDDLVVNGIEHKKTTSRSRWIFLGDSATYGQMVGFENSYPRLLQKKHPEVEVVNAGIIGAGNFQALRVYKKFLSHISHEKVVLGFYFFNDLRDNFTESPAVHDLPDEFQFASQKPIAEKNFLTSSAINKLIQLHLMQDPHSPLRPLSTLEQQRFFTPEGYSFYSYIDSEYLLYHPKEPWQLSFAYKELEGLLSELERLGKIMGAKFYLLLIPSRSMVFKRFYNTDIPPSTPEDFFKKRGLPYQPEILDFEQPYRKILAICRRQKNITCVDALPMARRLGESFFTPLDDHPSRRGQQELMDALDRAFQK